MRKLAWLLLAVAAAALAQLVIGPAVGPVASVRALFGTADGTTARIVGGLRVPRVLVALAAGACLGLAGAVLQAVLRNPLAAPEVTGVGSGAVLGAVTATVFGAAGAPNVLAAAAVVGGTLGGGVLWLVAARTAAEPVRLAVLGVVVSAVLAGLSLVLLTARPQLAGAVARWLVGSLASRTWEHWHALWPWLIVVMSALALLGPALDLLAVDDDHVRGVGLAVGPWRVAALGAAVLAVATAVSAVGAMSFVGLLAPHAARLLVGAEHRVLLPAAAMSGAAAVAGADALAQAVNSLAGGQRMGVPAGAITAMVGAMVLVAVARRSSRSILRGCG
ncbi:Fe(3+)-citrate import system permease protein YfmE [Longimycelium tulufanense]|uniref:Fe(3+)-citrate import system permease protein YfmE n=1 Tax=Longimycelium tulufanense TaxID=907463 RepID=A0A8J3C955_9PSEU|nr:iron ABC transporter permease [Longimycelium tulufanense]GGM58134.1 Fe(3+)-citrate import system permease protein YfmE [Longimycelium tulufanense]